ncbi:reverse transcriptase domain-containing protein [Sphingobacterium daejeonense]|uniref:reverse transcriptase domain-containing protein n=1 Tax=Sphingobacterium daejeonense TaxID=371142 RepID=UPI003D310442
MLSLSYFSSEAYIIDMLCRLRVKLAHHRNKNHLIHLHTTAKKHNYHVSQGTKGEELLTSLFPPRKQWRTVVRRKRMKNGVPRSSTEKTMLSLQATLRYYRYNRPDAPCLSRLDNFIKEVQDGIYGGAYKIGVPKIIPKLKEDKASQTGVNICRPIASFELKDKLILSITNRYLTAIFDRYFIDHSFAFRSKRTIKGKRMCPTHHDSVEEILSYRKLFPAGTLHVAECDMMKFFDTVNHTVIKKIFNQFFGRKGMECYPAKDLSNARRILYNYLDVYTFNKTVLPLNLKQSHFDRFKIPNGEYAWVGNELISNGYYKRLARAKIGIPQGGALSGLIANVVLHGVDRKITAMQDGKLLYLRFCDDMLIIHPNKEKCNHAFQQYLSGLRKKKLVVHPPVDPPYLTAKKFWSEKSKSCYKWGNESTMGSPWIGFVGYEIHYEGHIRVRKSSLLKEMKKQFRVVGDLKLILKDPHCRSGKGSIYESVASRLIGMSVGRVTLWNYNQIVNEMCWVSGYRLLSDNKYSRIQLKRLDSSRNRLLLKLRMLLAKMQSEVKPNAEDEQENIKMTESIYYGSPFSYYYQALKARESNPQHT